MRSLRSVVFALVALLVIAEPLALVASAAPRLRPWRPQARDAATFVRGPGAGELGAKLDRLSQARRSGVPFAIQEIEILDAWEEGLEIAQIEAEVLVSRDIYDVYVACTRTFKEGSLLARWRAYADEHAIVLQSRNLKLNEGLAQTIIPPDGSEDWRLYSDPEVYNQLSGAFQRRLERKFGRRGKARELRARMAAKTAAPGGGLPNTLVNNPNADMTTQDTQSETSLVLGSGTNILGSFNDSGSEETGSHFTGIARSTDAGVTWTDQGTLPNSTQGDAGDPVYARNNTTGTIVLMTLGFTTGAVLQAFRTTDNGATYGAPVNGAAGSGSHDKEWVTADNFAGTGNGNFYHFWRDFGGGGGMTFTRSTNDGVAWGNRQVLDSASGQGAWVTVGADHAVYAFWLDTGNVIVMRKSTDQGVTFGAPVTVVDVLSTGVNGDLGLTGGFRSNTFPQVVTDPNNANRLFMVYGDVGVAANDRADVFFTSSTDGGATWAPRSRVNTDSTTTQQFMPVIAITPDGTGLFMSWYDRRINGTLIDVFGVDGSVCADGSVALVPEYRISDGSWPVVVGQDSVIVSTYMGDYDQAVADNTTFYRTWGDNRLSRLTHVNQPDVRFTKVPKSAPAANVRAISSALLAENCTPDNDVIDPGETVTVSFTLRNAGAAATTNVVATLQATGGVTVPGAPQAYGGLAACGGQATQSFTFTASGICGANITATLQLQDGATNLGTVDFTLPTGLLGAPTPFSNAGLITITDNAAGNPYPSNITVSGITGVIGKVTVSLNTMSHTFPEDVDILLVGPGGQKAMVMSDVGGGTDIVNVNLTFDDAAATALGTGAITSGTFKPSDLQTGDILPAPAPQTASAADFTVFNGLTGASVNGTWSLYVRDDVGTDSGTITGGWTLNISTLSCATSCGGGGPMGDSIGLNLNGTNTFFLRNSNSSGAADITTFFGGGTFVPVRGDYDGNGTDTIGGYDASSGCFFLRNANTPGPADAIVCFGPGGAGIIPLVGDWDGNGTDTVGIYIEATGTFFLRNSNTPGGADITVNFGPGGAGIVPLTGDWDGNGTDTVGIYLSASGAFFLRNSNTPGGADLVFTFGAGGSVVPLSGDWNNDGTDSIGLFDAGTGAFFLKNMNAGGGADIVFTFGAGGAVTPLTGDWDGL